MSASGDNETSKLLSEKQLNFQFYYTDMTTLKTIVRSNPDSWKFERNHYPKMHWNDLGAF